jgi:hypothetical protein
LTVVALDATAAVLWLIQAEDARLDAATMNNLEAKRIMLVTAASYERMRNISRAWDDQVCRTRGRKLISD